MITLVLDRFYEKYVENTFEDAAERASRTCASSRNTRCSTTGRRRFSRNSRSWERPPQQDPRLQEIETSRMSRWSLTSVHQAKGLEWKVVFLIWLTDTRFPSPRSLPDPGGEEEERRLFLRRPHAREGRTLHVPAYAREREVEQGRVLASFEIRGGIAG